MLAYVHEPIISVCCLNTIAEGLWLVSKELVECSKLILIVAMALISLVVLLQSCISICVLALVAAITACHASGGGGGGGRSGFGVVRVGGAILKRLTSISTLTDKYRS